jgi:hypothetical protein
LETSARDHVITVQHRSHTAASRLFARNEGIALARDFHEGDTFASRRFAVAVDGRGSSRRVANETEVGVSARQATGR